MDSPSPRLRSVSRRGLLESAASFGLLAGDRERLAGRRDGSRDRGRLESRQHRPALSSPLGSSSSERDRTEALRNFLAYAGRHDVRGDRVVHHMEVSIFTNLIGTTLERQFKVAGDILTIRTLPPEIWNSSNVHVWKRA